MYLYYILPKAYYVLLCKKCYQLSINISSFKQNIPYIYLYYVLKYMYSHVNVLCILTYKKICHIYVQVCTSLWPTTGYRQITSIIKKLLIISGIEKNPGPQPRQNRTTPNDAGMTSNFSMIHINAQSLRYKLSELETESEDADVIAVTETWLGPSIETQNLTIPSFKEPLRKDRLGDPHGGVALYCREKHVMNHRKDLDVKDLEAVWAEMNIKGKKILVAAMYRPLNANVEYWNLIEESINQAKQANIPNMFILGDLNCNVQTPNNRLEIILSNFHFTQIITEPTHYTPTSATIIDIIATTSLDLVKNTSVRSPSLSNHCDTCVILTLKPEQQKTVNRKTYNYKKANWENLRKKLGNDISTPRY
jgi:hypothetical protein